jgi:putative nucleotidyltransferase with HDIG domain
MQVNMELWLVFSLFVAYNYGRKHAMLTALASALLVALLAFVNPELLSSQSLLAGQKWFDTIAWGGILVVVAYAMGTLYERKERHFHELRRAYHGVLMILGHFVAKDKYTENHSYRVSVYAMKIAGEMGFDNERIEDVRAAALLHDIGKLDVSREILYKAAKLTDAEYAEVASHVEKGVNILQPVGGALTRVIPIILAHHDKFDGSGPHKISGEDIPLEARIIAVADAYDAITSDRPYRRAMSAFEANNIIVNLSGKNFDPIVVDAFVRAFARNQMEVPEVMI